MHALLLGLTLLAAPVEPGPCTYGPVPTRTPYTTEVPRCGPGGHLSLRTAWRAVRRYGPWALGAAALAVALGRGDQETVYVVHAPHRPHRD